MKLIDKNKILSKRRKPVVAKTKGPSVLPFNPFEKSNKQNRHYGIFYSDNQRNAIGIGSDLITLCDMCENLNKRKREILKSDSRTFLIRTLSDKELPNYTITDIYMVLTVDDVKRNFMKMRGISLW